MKARNDRTLNKYKRYKNKLTSILRQAEKDYFSKKIFEARDSISKTWSILNRLTKKTGSNESINKIGIGNTVINDPTVIPQKFNDFLALFSSSEKRRLCYRRVRPSVRLSVCKPIFSRTIRHTEPIFSASLRLYFPWNQSKCGSFLTTKFGITW